MAAISTAWTKNLADPEKAAEFEALVRNSTQVLSRLLDLVCEFEADLIVQETSISDFEDPAWAAKQAWRNGGRAFAKKVKDQLNFVKG